MARLITTGFELNDLANGAVASHPDPFTSGGATAATNGTNNPRSGARNITMPFNGAATCFITSVITTVTAVTYSFRAYLYISVLPASGQSIRLFDFGSALSVGRLVLDDAGSIRLSGADPILAVAPAGVFFRFEVQWKIDTANVANDTFEARVNGDVAYSATAGLGTTLPAAIRLGASAITGVPGAITIDVDDVALNDSTGGSQTGYPGSGRVVLLVPTADSAVGTGWTLGTGTAISANSGKTAVSNKPPLGVADLAVGSDVKQIRNATANANVNYDATMTTYSAAGLITGDTVNVVTPIIATAAPVVTSAKAGTVGVVSNPAIANVALGAGGTAGAFWSGTTAGTYPTGWKWSNGTVTYAPSVTLGTAPVMRITQVTSSTRIAMVSAMGMYVEYLPAPVSDIPSIERRTPRRRLLQRL